MSAARIGLAVVLLVSASGCTLIDAFSPPAPEGPGAAYESYLAGSSTTIVVELDHAPDATWDRSTPAEEQFVEQLERITQKQVEVRYDQELPADGSEYAYSTSELQELHREHRELEPGNGTEVIHALFLQGKYQQEGVAGLSFATRSYAVFMGQIEEITCEDDTPVCNYSCPDDDPLCTRQLNPAVREWRLARSVAIHEAGHMFGLVNSPLPMVEDHEDPEHPGHTTNETSVMFWQVERTPEPDDFFDGGQVPWQFGEHDIQDARAIQQ